MLKNVTKTLAELGRPIRECRRAKKMSLEALGEKCELSGSYLARIEKGDLASPPSEAALRKICDVLGLDAVPLIALSRLARPESPARGIGTMTPRAEAELVRLAERALAVAQEEHGQDEIDSAIAIGEIARELFDKGGMFAVDLYHTLARLYSDRSNVFNRRKDTLEDHAAALGYLEQVITLIRVDPAPPLRHRRYLAETYALAGEIFSLIAVPFGDRGQLAEQSLEKWTAILDQDGAAPRFLESQNQPQSTEEDDQNQESALRRFLNTAEAVKRNLLSTCCFLVARALDERASQELELLMAEQSVAPDLVDRELELAAARLAYIQVWERKCAGDLEKLQTNFSLTFREESIERLRNLERTALSSEQSRVRAMIAAFHDEFAFRLGLGVYMEEATWQYYWASQLDPRVSLWKRLDRVASALEDANFDPLRLREIVEKVTADAELFRNSEVPYPIIYKQWLRERELGDKPRRSRG